MSLFIKELGQEFKSKNAAIAELVKHKDSIIQAKKSQILKSHEKGLGLTVKAINPNKLQDACKELNVEDGYYYLAVNTTNILDSHEDLHVKGIWNRTVKDQQGKNFLVMDHSLKISDVVVRKDKIKMMVKEIPFRLIGKDYEGNTQALIYAFKKEDVISEVAKQWLESDSDIEASVRMQYVTILFALDSNEKEHKQYKRNYDKYFPEIANKEAAENLEYFWVIKEAKNIGESSLVLFGSNHATGLIEDEKDQKNLKELVNDLESAIKSKINSKFEAQEAKELLTNLSKELEKPFKNTSEPPKSTHKSILMLRNKPNFN